MLVPQCCSSPVHLPLTSTTLMAMSLVTPSALSMAFLGQENMPPSLLNETDCDDDVLLLAPFASASCSSSAKLTLPQRVYVGAASNVLLETSVVRVSRKRSRGMLTSSAVRISPLETPRFLLAAPRPQHQHHQAASFDAAELDIDSESLECRPAFCMFEHMPEELVLQIFTMLDPSDLAAAARVCSAWSRITLDPMLWRVLSHRDYGHFLELSSAAPASLPSHDSTSVSCWRRWYMTRHHRRLAQHARARAKPLLSALTATLPFAHLAPSYSPATATLPFAMSFTSQPSFFGSNTTIATPPPPPPPSITYGTKRRRIL